MKLRDLIDKLQFDGRLAQIKKPVSYNLDAAAIIYELEEKPVLFHNISGYRYPVVAGLCSRRELFAEAFGVTKDKLTAKLAAATKKPIEPQMASRAPCQEVVEEKVDLDSFPILHHFPKDGGPYITADVAIVRDPDTGRNACVHRLMKIGKDRLVARLDEGRQTHTTYHKMMKSGKDLEIAFCIGNSLAVMLGAAISAAPGVDELAIANALDDTPLVKCKTKDLEVPADSEIILEGRIIAEQHDEGPFVDLTETQDIIRQQPVVIIDKITHRRDAIFQALLPGKREHKMLMGMPREPTMYNEVNKVCNCKNVVLTMGGCSWYHAVVQIKKKNNADPFEAGKAAFRGHKSLKHCIVVDEDIDPTDMNQVEWALATRFRADKRTLILEDQPSSTLDAMADKPTGAKATTERPKIAKVCLDATIPLGDPKRPPKKFARVEYKKVDLKEFL